MRRLILTASALVLASAAMILTGCQNTAAPSDIVFAAAASLNQAEVLATAYVKSPVADPAVVAEIKKVDGQAFAIINPLEQAALANPGSITNANAAIAQTALADFTGILQSKGIK